MVDRRSLVVPSTNGHGDTDHCWNSGSDKNDGIKEPFMPDFEPTDYKSVRTFLARVDILLFGPSNFSWDIVKVLLRKALKRTPIGSTWWDIEGENCKDIKDFRTKFVQYFDNKQIEDRVSLDLVKLSPKSMKVNDIMYYLEDYAEIALFSRRAFDFHRAVIFSKLIQYDGIEKLIHRSANITNMYQLVKEVSKLEEDQNLHGSPHENSKTYISDESTIVPGITRSNGSGGDQSSLKSTTNLSSSTNSDSLTRKYNINTSVLHSCSTSTTPVSSKYSLSDNENPEQPKPQSSIARKRTMGIPLKLSKLFPVFSLFSQISIDRDFPVLKDRHGDPVWVNVCLRSESNSNFISTDLVKKYDLIEKTTGYLMKLPDNYCPLQQDYLPEQSVLECVTQVTLNIPCKDGKWFNFTTELYVANFLPSGITLGQPWFDRFSPRIDSSKDTCTIDDCTFQPNYRDPVKASKKKKKVKN
ncbi:hypothetical protein TRICI_000959 [Trichomonascus ciferrii]|uniref:Uncharacterized protein n=1 Tax=Trichomonascus ciferrii TaxID=44093 RepID=A0A642V9M2_9ASCO|nr:hypothetical protein TRICI_000959 [Trichomonascus ciferrii]